MGRVTDIVETELTYNLEKPRAKLLPSSKSQEPGEKEGY
jgi:hypothetical protein